MRYIKKIFKSYDIDFWVFIILCGVFTVAACYVNDLAEFSAKRLYIQLFGATTLLCVFLIQPNKNYNASPFTWLSSKAGEKFKETFSPIQLNNYRAHILILSALFVVFTIRMLLRFLSGAHPAVLTAYALFLLVLILSLYIGLKRSFSERLALMLICLSMVFPVAMDMFLEKPASGHSPDAYVWIIISVVFSMFLVSRRMPRIFFKLFTCVLFLGMISEIYFIKGTNASRTLEFTSNIFYVGFVVYVALEFYTAHTIKNYKALEDINKELKDAQEQMLQREQMATLGQLIAGIAHEINTPIGAIIASAEMLDSFNIGRLLRDVKKYNDEDLDALLVLIGICIKTAKNMRSTVEIRHGRAQMRKYLSSINLPNASAISSELSAMDICDIEKVADNIDIFLRENITDLLRSARILLTYITSVQNIQFASEKIKKIIFALKSFSHMNTTGEEHEFDVVKNIDNILVLYQNQLKRGVEIIKLYDENIPYVYGNIEEIGQVWTNIAQNAIHAMSYVGKLTISVKHANHCVEVSFTDTGTGIPAEDIEKIFTPFYTTKPLGEGSGLGLDICRKIIHKHGGRISVESKLGAGTTFTVTLPVRHDTTEMRRI